NGQGTGPGFKYFLRPGVPGRAKQAKEDRDPLDHRAKDNILGKDCGCIRIKAGWPSCLCCRAIFYFYGMARPAFDDIYMELAVNLARRSHCIMRHVGAVLTKDTRIISIGYNGPPPGTHNCDEEWPDT